MGKLALGTLRKRLKLSATSFDVHGSIVVGFALHWTWVWVTFWSSVFYSISPVLQPHTSAIMSLEPLWLLSLLTNVLGYGALFVLSVKRTVVGDSTILPLCAAIITAMGTLLDLLSDRCLLRRAGGVHLCAWRPAHRGRQRHRGYPMGRASEHPGGAPNRRLQRAGDPGCQRLLPAHHDLAQSNRTVLDGGTPRRRDVAVHAQPGHGARSPHHRANRGRHRRQGQKGCPPRARRW